MMFDSPTKRRKTRGTNFAMKATKQKAPSWPPNQLPVELFTLIISYLPRSTIQDMRLVNKEFEEKVSEYLFRVVVVPFKPEIYGITPEPSHASQARQGSVMLQDKGMRVFQGFGRHILRFAMSFEFDEAKLARPPAKSDQEAITSFWGIYLWPFKKYNRYAQLEGLEQTADETRTMAKALRFIENAKELGLSIDGGLGWLSGPDINQKFIERGEKVTVFGASRFPPEPKAKPAKVGKSPFPFQTRSSLETTPDTHGTDRHATLQRILTEAGYQGENLDQGMRILESEDQATENQSTEPWESFTSNFNGESLRQIPSPRALMNLGNRISQLGGEAFEQGTITVSDDEDDEIEFQSDIGGSILVSATNKSSRVKPDGHSLKPNDLTTAQREMLLEIEWAQRAFMQSYAIAIIDNPLTFKNIETLTIARLPNRHLHILRREDFWDSLPQLTKLSLAIIPDWRDVVKLPTSWVQDNKVPPSLAVYSVWLLLQDQISHRKNIKTLHLEWFCGGEEAPGLFSRNQHMLAAPIISKAMEMVNRVNPPHLLSLPYIEHLTLKNCWISPHILTRFVLSLKQCRLQSLNLISVSLTAPLPPHAHPNPLAGNAVNAANMQNAQQLVNHAVNVMGMNLGPGHALPAIPPAPTTPNTQPNNDPDWLEPPRHDSWAHVIDVLTPGQRLADIRYARGIGPEPQPQMQTQLRKLTFDSCGYIRLPLDFDQTAVGHNDTNGAQAGPIAKRISELESFMMKPHDSTLGIIVNRMDNLEERTLENAWNLGVGWALTKPILAAEAQADGILSAGQGRFQGTIETSLFSTSR